MFEMLNQYGALLYTKVGPSMHTQVITHYMEQFKNLNSLLDKFVLPDALKKHREHEALAKRNEETLSKNSQLRAFLAKKRGDMAQFTIANHVAARV